MKPEPQSAADLVVLCTVGYQLVDIGREYPDAISESELKAWIEEINTRANQIMEQPGFKSIKKASNELECSGTDDSKRFSLLKAAALLTHPSMSAIAGNLTQFQAAVERAMYTCQAEASEEVQSQATRLANLMVVSCRCPTGLAKKDFAEPARFLQMLHRYWMLAGAMVQIQATVHVGFAPHPLMFLIENLRDRLSTCFSKVLHIDGAEEARLACDELVGLLTEGDIDDLSSVPECTNSELQKVERFIARARLKIGPREFALTAAEDYFIKLAKHLIEEHDKRCRVAWKQILARSDAQAAARKSAEVVPVMSVHAAASNTTMSREQIAERIGPLLSSLNAADKGVKSLGARLRSLAVRGKAVNTQAFAAKVQDQLRKWVEPITRQLLLAEAASSGVSPHLVGLTAEPLSWEVDTRLAIRNLISRLDGLICSYGGETEESFVADAASSLRERVQRLQVAFEAQSAQRASQHPHATPSAMPGDLNDPARPKVMLRRPGEPCIVNGKVKKALTDGQHHVLAELIAAGDQGLKKDTIERLRRSARRMLEDLRKDPDWAEVIIMPGQTNGRYRVLT